MGVVSPWLYNIYKFGCVRDLRVRVGSLCGKLKVKGTKQSLVAGLLAYESAVGIKWGGYCREI